MSEHVQSACNYRGFILLEMIVNTHVEWRTFDMDAKPDRYIVADSRATAEDRIDSGQAKMRLEKMHAPSKSRRVANSHKRAEIFLAESLS